MSTYTATSVYVAICPRACMQNVSTCGAVPNVNGALWRRRRRTPYIDARGHTAMHVAVCPRASITQHAPKPKPTAYKILRTETTLVYNKYNTINPMHNSFTTLTWV